MSPSDYKDLIQQLIDHEGLRLDPYQDSKGKLTIGVGYNLEDRGPGPLERAIGRTLDPLRLTREEAVRGCAADIERFETEIVEMWPRFESLDVIRKRAFIDFVFNLGTAKAARFTQAKRFADLAIDLEQSRDLSPTSQRTHSLIEAAWTACAFHGVESVWARQVDDGLGGRFGRADRLATMIRIGRDPKVH